MPTRNDLPKSGLVSTRILKFHFLNECTKLLRSNMFGSDFRYYISHICAVILKMHAPEVTLSDPGRFKKFQSKSEMALSGPQEAEITPKARSELCNPAGSSLVGGGREPFQWSGEVQRSALAMPRISRPRSTPGPLAISDVTSTSRGAVDRQAR
ncbi:hypothetical protein [Rhodococcus sp. 1163]|uniref:hypothetical protein n=1 Tax=Rhodococcus sp. 1163 TaxID=1905289 RepID=UPI0015C45F20|nr:hypothetical protein [Rhodococcus sp. 1163]